MTVSVPVASLPGPHSDAEAAVAGILAVVEAFDAMTHERPYRGAQSSNWALAELKRCRCALRSRRRGGVPPTSVSVSQVS